MNQLAEWKCHKVVRAGKILEAFEVSAPNTVVKVVGADGGPALVECDPGVFARGAPIVGDYIVVYEEGYTSWSPRGVFESGYTLLAAS